MRRFEATGLVVETGSGGRTKYNRQQRNLPKTHWLDAVCVGQSTIDELKLDGVRPLLIKAMGQVQRQVCDTDNFGFRRKKSNEDYTPPKLIKRVHGF